MTISFLHYGWPNRNNWKYTSSDCSTSGGPIINTFENATELAIKILDSHSGRWRNLHITAVANIFERFSAYTQPNQLVNIYLKVFNDLSLQVDPQPPQVPNFMMSSEFNPTQLMLIDFPLTSVNIFWGNITHLTLRNISAEEGIDILQRAPTLEYYDISLCQSSDTIFREPSLHSRLHSLKLTNYVEGFLEAITHPSLEECTQYIRDIDPLLVAVMVSLLNRSGCCLKALNLNYVPDDVESLITLLQAIPSLERINLSFDFGFVPSPMMDEILIRIFYPPPGSEDPATNSFLPCLQSMPHCRSPDYGDPFSWDRIPQLYHLGHRRLRTLGSTAYGYQSPINHETALQLLQLADEGVDFEIIDEKMGGDYMRLAKFWLREPWLDHLE